MVQLNILSGKKAGSQQVVRRFPFCVGRAVQNDLQLDDDGVWDRHLTLEFQKNEGFRIAAAKNALITINNKSIEAEILRNGDIVTLGSARLQFWLAAARQRRLRGRESFVWFLLIAVTGGQFILLYWLFR